MDEVIKALKRINAGKFVGYDRVSSEMLRGSGGIVASLLYHLFNKFWRSHRVPNDWCQSVIVPLYKGKDSRQVWGLQEMINKMNDTVKKKGMKVSVNKTKVMVFERGESTI
ncbi:hypothetical protein EVAR_63936_1 [Eumeta japonica]|uniref:Reverse transcriptase domain-containing protein n=1 Tax=Eumeta variegata TaxID=151549 RepID=A0A4C1ZK37_EUMVA|nr:hypothetical protein EVAR_63936_1 [Eumeta japonica]